MLNLNPNLKIINKKAVSEGAKYWGCKMKGTPEMVLESSWGNGDCVFALSQCSKQTIIIWLIIRTRGW